MNLICSLNQADLVLYLLGVRSPLPDLDEIEKEAIRELPLG